jgi:hypothetical protein
MMPGRSTSPLFFPLAVTAAFLLGGCGSSERRELTGESSRPVDFSGSWEMDYGQSDNIQAKLNALVRDLRQQSQRRSQSGMGQQGATTITIGGSGYNSGPSIIGLAQMADMITQSPLLDVKQDERGIKVKREENFALDCEFHAGQFHLVETPFGTESCGWSSHQLVFRIILPEGLSIQHVMTLGPEGERLNVATTVVSDQVSYPFTLNRVYNRFEPGNQGYTCKMTLTRGRVCTTESQ